MCSLAGIKQAPKALTKTNIYEEIISSNKLLDDEPVPETERVLVVTPATYLSPDEAVQGHHDGDGHRQRHAHQGRDCEP